jgi:hypothetical protein
VIGYALWLSSAAGPRAYRRLCGPGSTFPPMYSGSRRCDSDGRRGLSRFIGERDERGDIFYGSGYGLEHGPRPGRGRVAVAVEGGHQVDLGDRPLRVSAAQLLTAGGSIFVLPWYSALIFAVVWRRVGR